MGLLVVDRKHTVVDLFSGAGGTALGFHRAGFEVVGASDIDPAAVTTYQNNIGLQPLLADLDTLSPWDFMDHFNIAPGLVDVLVGCPPCQGFTRMRGKKGKTDGRNRLVLRYLDYVEAIRPRCVVFENVPGIIRQKHGLSFFRQLTSGLLDLEYGFDPHNPGRELNAADYGVPQSRKRIVLIAGKDRQLIPFPEPTHAMKSTAALSQQLQPWVTVRQAFDGIPPVRAGESSPHFANHAASRIGDRVMNFISLVPIDGGSRLEVPEEYWLDCHRKQGCGHADVYGRLAWDVPSGVMTSGCNNVSKGRFIHPEANRGITPREAARLQSFPDSFVFYGTIAQVTSQIGNAVPPLLAYHIAVAIRNWLDVQPPIPASAAIQRLSDLVLPLSLG